MCKHQVLPVWACDACHQVAEQRKCSETWAGSHAGDGEAHSTDYSVDHSGQPEHFLRAEELLPPDLEHAGPPLSPVSVSCQTISLI